MLTEPSSQGNPAVEPIADRPVDGLRSNELTSNMAEFKVGDVSYTYRGVNERGGMQFTSMAPDGQQRPVTVYRSQSQGSLRVGQAYEIERTEGERPRLRMMKGAELSPDHQYTQDTQLHPAFEDAVARIEETSGLQGAESNIWAYETPDAERLMEDFAAQREVRPLVVGYIDDQLHKLRAGYLSRNDMSTLTGFHNMQGARANFERKIDILNMVLLDSGVMPDFSGEPTTVELNEHPLLGNVVKETFTKVVNGRPYEWQMAHDQYGRAWVERIRFADAEPTPYGTDKEVVYSGVLTSKPLEYKEQCDGLPDSMRTDVDGRYSDISLFLRELAPVAQYSAHYAKREQVYSFATTK